MNGNMFTHLIAQKSNDLNVAALLSQYWYALAAVIVIGVVVKMSRSRRKPRSYRW
ncbi:MAG TPA: hypothetical protein VJ835_08785 [Fimbriimonadaceae bacterium]|jgi:hypothetical protein|nr:hypothetical protein [Fimbriimonadaceae bacterium]